MNVDFQLGICLPQGRDFEVVSRHLRISAEAAANYCNELFAKQCSMEVNFIQEPCESRDVWLAGPHKQDVLVGPICSLHAWEILQKWPPTLTAAVSPGADLASLSSLRKSLPFFRVCGDGGQFATEITALALNQLGCRRPLVIFDATSRWWAEVALVLANGVRRQAKFTPTMFQFDPKKLEYDLLRPGQRAEYDYSDLICYLGNTPARIQEITALLLNGTHRRVLYPATLAQEVSDVLTSAEFQADGRVYTLRFQAPEITRKGQSHLNRLTTKLGFGPSSYAAQMYDAVLVAGEALLKLFAEGRPRSHLAEVLKTIMVEGCTGTIQFDSYGNRRDQGHWQLAVWRKGQFSRRRSLPSRSPVFEETGTERVAVVIKKENKYTNVVQLRNLIRSCEGRIDWSDPHFHRRALEELRFAEDAESVTEIRILSRPLNVNPRAKKDFQRFKEEMQSKGIAAEWRYRTERYSHDRFILDENRFFNVPPVNAIYEGQYSEFLETPNRPPFEEWWSRAIPIEQMPAATLETTAEES